MAINVFQHFWGISQVATDTKQAEILLKYFIAMFQEECGNGNAMLQFGFSIVSWLPKTHSTSLPRIPQTSARGSFLFVGFSEASQTEILIWPDDDAVIVTKYTIRVFLPTAWLELSIISVITSFINVAPMVPGPQPSSPQLRSDQSRLLRSRCT